MGTTQPIGSARLRPLEQNSCVEELQIVRKWIEKEEKDEKVPSQQPE